MMDEEVKEENPIQENVGAHLNYAFNTGVSPNPQSFSHDEIGDLLQAGYDLNNLDFLHEKQLSNDHAQKNPIEMHAPKEIPRKNENEIQIPNNSENEMSTENKNCMNVDIETLTIEQTCQKDSKVSKHNFHIPNDVLDNLEGLVSWRQIKTHANRLYRHFFYNKKFGFQCQLMLQLIKMSKMQKVMIRLGMYAKPENKNESLKQVVSIVASTFDVIRKRSWSKDKNAAW